MAVNTVGGVNVMIQAMTTPQKTSGGPLTTVDAYLDMLVKDLQEKQGCHTAIVYGSRARGDRITGRPEGAWR